MSVRVKQTSDRENRNKGTLSQLGYIADKVGSKWQYYQINQ
jgi:hypothetical protein